MGLLNNITLQSLSQTNYNQSPIISRPTQAFPTLTDIRKSTIFNTFSTFFFTTANRQSVKFYQTTFTRMLDTSVKVHRQEFFGIEYDHPYDELVYDDLSFLSCMFHSIQSQDSGAAISLSNFRYQLLVIFTGFSSCVTADSGGAIYMKGLEFAADRSCFYCCVGMYGEQSISVDLNKYARHDLRDNNLTSTLISYCSPESHIGERRAALFSNGIQTVKNNNFTRNYVKDEAAALVVAYPIAFCFAYNLISTSTGPNVLWLHQMHVNNPLMYTNIVNTSALKDSATIEIESSNLVMESCVFAGNVFSVFISGGDAATIIKCVFDVPLYHSMFKSVRIQMKELHKFDRPKTISIRLAPTWNCWALGVPSPSAIPKSRFDVLKAHPVGIILVLAGVFLSIIAGIVLASCRKGKTPVVFE